MGLYSFEFKNVLGKSQKQQLKPNNMSDKKTFENDYKEVTFDKSKTKNHSFYDCLIISVETKIVTRTHVSFVVETIKNKNHKLELMHEQNILDVSFIRECNDGKINWYFENHITPRLSDRLTKELEERYKESIEKRFEREKTFTNPELGITYIHTEPRERKESQQPEKIYSKEEMETLSDYFTFEVIAYSNPRRYRKKPLGMSTTNETHRVCDISTVLKSERNEKPILKKLFNKFMSIFD